MKEDIPGPHISWEISIYAEQACYLILNWNFNCKIWENVYIPKSTF